MERNYSKNEQAYIDILKSYRRKVNQDHNYMKEKEKKEVDEIVNSEHSDTKSIESSDSDCSNCIVPNLVVPPINISNENVDVDVAQNIEIENENSVQIGHSNNGFVVQTDSGLGSETFIREIGHTISYKLMPGYTVGKI